MADHSAPSQYQRLFRILFGVGPLLIALYLFRKTLTPFTQAGGNTTIVSADADTIMELGFAIFLLIVAGISLAPAMAQLITTPARHWIDTLYASSGGEVTPDLQPAWKLAKKYIAEERWDDAVETLQRIITYYPDERDAYAAGIDAARQAGDIEALEWFADALKKQKGWRR